MPGGGAALTVRFVLITTSRPRSDEELLAAHVAGDRYAFEELFYRYHPQLHRVALRRCRSPEDAADALQEAMLSAHRSAPAFRQHASVRTWLHRIVVNKCHDQLRALRDRPTTAADCEAYARGLPPTGDTTVGIDTAITVRRALAALSADQRAAILAVDVHGYSIAEAAQLFGIAEGTVKSRCHRGRTRLAALLAGVQAAAA
ncbi:RNA polymerase sigma factor SigM [soil metagenome]